jgi:hypothetical protein
MNIEEFRVAWQQTKPGDEIVYHKGYCLEGSTCSFQIIQEVRVLWDSGVATLVQRRRQDRDLDYLVIRNHHRRRPALRFSDNWGDTFGNR